MKPDMKVLMLDGVPYAIKDLLDGPHMDSRYEKGPWCLKAHTLYNQDMKFLGTIVQCQNKGRWAAVHEGVPGRDNKYLYQHKDRDSAIRELVRKERK